VSQASVAYARGKQDQQNGRPSQPPKPKLSGEEKRALKKLRREARQAGATLESNGEGGLPPSLVLGRMRRDGYRCSNEDCPNPKKDLTVDHISGHPKEIHADPKARKRADLRRGIAAGHVSTMDAIHTICARCHDQVHTRERQIDDGKKPDPMPGKER
jgi:5-methylcytosine-specific restriction endonuclease McrA